MTGGEQKAGADKGEGKCGRLRHLKELNVVQKERGWDIGRRAIDNSEPKVVHPRDINGDAEGLVTGLQHEGIALAGRRMKKRAKCIGDNWRIPRQPEREKCKVVMCPGLDFVGQEIVIERNHVVRVQHSEVQLKRGTLLAGNKTIANGPGRDTEEIGNRHYRNSAGASGDRSVTRIADLIDCAERELMSSFSRINPEVAQLNAGVANSRSRSEAVLEPFDQRGSRRVRWQDQESDRENQPGYKPSP